MKVTVCFENVRVVVPCGDGSLLVRDLMHEAILRYRKATGKTDAGPTIISLSSLTGGGLLDPDDRLCDVADDREQIVAHLSHTDVQHHVGGDGASSVGTNSPDLFHTDGSGNKDHHYPHHIYSQSHHHPHRSGGGSSSGYGMDVQSRINSNIKRESVKRLSMHALSNREPCTSNYSALSLPRESRRREPLGQDSKAAFDLTNFKSDNVDIREVIIKNDAGPLGLHVVPCYDLLGNDQGLRVEKIEPNGRIAKDGQIELYDKIIKMNGHNLLRIPFTNVQEIFRTCMAEKCLKITIMKGKKSSNIKSLRNNNEKLDNDDVIKKLQTSDNILQNANTRKIGRMLEIELIKGKGLGFSVTTRDNPAGGHCPIYIKNILLEGAAVEDGRLRPGDRLLEVNGIEMTGKSQAEAVSLFRSIPAGGKVRLKVSRQEEVTSTSSLTTATTTATNDMSNNNNASIPESNLEASPDNTKWNVNISSTSSIQSPILKSDLSNSIAERYEKLNQLSFKPTLTSSDDIILSPRKHRMVLTLDIPVHDSEKAGLGVSVKGKTSTADDNTNMDLGIFIKSVLNGGAASRDGRLRTNDQLLNVNGVSLLNLPNSEAMETLRRAMLNTNSSLTGVITLTIARRVSSSSSLYDGEHNIINENGIATSSPTLVSKTDTINSRFIPNDNNKYDNTNCIVEKNNINNHFELDNIKGITEMSNSSTSTTPTATSSNPNLLTSPWNPVIERLTEQYNKNSLRNESYCLATNKTWLESVSGNVKKLTGQRNATAAAAAVDDNNDSILIEETDNVNDNNTKLTDDSGKKLIDDKDSQYSGDITYDSQLSLEEINNSSSMGNKFSRDAIGRQSMSEKRHAALDAKNTDTYKRNKKLREGRESNKVNDAINKSEIINSSNNIGGGNSGADDGGKFNSDMDKIKNIGESTFEINRRRFEKNIFDNVSAVTTATTSLSSTTTAAATSSSSSDYVYTISGSNNKFSSPRKHWLVDDETVNVNSSTIGNQFKEDSSGEGFSNTRGDVKQASLNSALDKRSRKKGFKSMLRLGKNRKSLNFGDNIEARHETSNYCSAFRLVPRQLVLEQKRYRGKINVTKPRKPHFIRGVFNELVTPFYPPSREPKPLWELCENIKLKDPVATACKNEPNEYEIIIARECLNWFKTSRMVAFLHENSIRSEDKRDVEVDLRYSNMYFKWYGPKIFKTALTGTFYEPVLPLLCSKGMLVFSPEPNTKELRKILRTAPQFILMAGILDSTLLNVNDFLKYGEIDITEARGGLVQTLQTAAGGNLCRQLTHHQSTFVSRLDQIRNNETKTNETDNTKSEIITE
ncbi:hypothetical protein PV327_009551 [Microctonus hyperodae]|uniref:PDZ domain-containing protein n=1 Tax=Microctonus hyperodae TaxID=165561 RepID=A0AA39CAW4_MICHY|nr:hypothetical protein PV327_009551 [Microctonus hyperodae]